MTLLLHCQSCKKFTCLATRVQVCKKETMLDKPVNTNHTDQKCQICEKAFKTSRELIQHVAKEHHNEEGFRNA